MTLELDAPPPSGSRARRVTGEVFRSLSVPNFRLFFAGQFVSQNGNWLTLVAQTLLVLEITGSGVALGIITACQFGPLLVLGPWTGLLADRVDKRRLLIAVQVGAMAQSFALGALAFLDHPPLAALYAVALAGGLAFALDNPARRAFVVELVPPDHVQNAVSLNTAMMTGGRIGGTALAGLLISTVGYGWCFVLDGLSYVAVLVSLWRIDTRETVPRRSGRAPGQLLAGVRYVARLPELWVSLTMTAIVGTLAYNFQVVFPLFAERTLDGDVGTFTILFAITAAGSMVGALLTARATTVGIRRVSVTSIAFGLAITLMALAPTFLLAEVAAALLGVTSMVFMTTATAIVQLRCDIEMRGRVLALQSIVILGSTPIGGPIVGAVCDWWGPRAGFGLGAASALGAGAWGATRAGVPAGGTISGLDQPLVAE